MIEMISSLIEKDFAYEANNHVYFEVSKFVDCILNDKPVSESNSSDAYNAMELVHRCYQDSGFPTYQKVEN